MSNKRKIKEGKGTPEKPVSEAEFRRRILNTARHFNCEEDVKQIFAKYDRLLKNCKNEKEYRHIAYTGLIELHNFFYCRGALVVNGLELMPAQEEVSTPGKIIKLN